MATESIDQPTSNSRTRKYLTYFLLSFGAISLSLFLVVNWYHNLLFSTDSWLQVVTPLTQEPAVVNDVSNLTVTKLFEGVNIEERIANALPPQAAFVAAPLTDQLRFRAQTATSNLIRSDRFQAIWVEANRRLHSRLVSFLLNPNADPQNGTITLNLGQALPSVVSSLGQSGQTFFANLNLEERGNIEIQMPPALQRLKMSSLWAGALNRILLPLALLFYALALLTSPRKQQFFLVGSLITTGVITLLYVLLRASGNEVVGLVNTPQYQDTVRIFWDQLSAVLITSIVTVLIISLIISAVAVFLGPYQWARRMRQNVGLKINKNGQFMNSLETARNWLSNHKVIVGIVILVLTSIWLISATVITYSIVIATLCLAFAAIAFIYSLASTKLT